MTAQLLLLAQQSRRNRTNFPSSQLVAQIGLSAHKWPSGNACRAGSLLCYPALAFGAIHDQN
jgi:hypothetical protein